MNGTISDLFNALGLAGVGAEITPHGTVRLTGNRPSDDLRARVVQHKTIILDALHLSDRLERGWTLCEAATGAERDRLDDHWIALLRQYERLMGTPLDAAEGRAA